MYLSQIQLVSEIDAISRVRVLVGGNPANDHDVRQFQSVTLTRYGLEADLSGQSSISQSVYRRCIHSLREVDLQKYAQDYKRIKLMYLRDIQSSSRGWIPWSDFKRRIADQVHYKWILTVVARYYDQPKACLQWLAYDERMLLTTNEDISQEIESYIDYEHELSGFTYPDEVVADLRSILSEWLKDFSLGEERPDPCYGPGAVAEWKGRLPHLRKAERTLYDPHTVAVLCQYWDCDEDELIIGHPSLDASRQNKIIFRPKNALAHRIISAEPCWLSWLQQAIKRPLYDYVERSRKLFTWFSNQERSREYALLGSIDGRYATFDFSSASDSITTELVARVFRDTYVVEPLLLTRSTSALMPDGRTVLLHKFAPMGSATCFVTMDLIILSMCERAIRTALGRPGKLGDYVVYGDDVIIRSDAALAFANLSRSLNMTINYDKSYWETDTYNYYRESCGIEAFNGTDITPLRYSRFQEPIVDVRTISESYFSSVISLMNRAYVDYGYDNLRSVVQECVRYSGRRRNKHASARFFTIWDHALRVDYSDYISGRDGPYAVAVPDGTATNYRCKQRTSSSLQRREFLITRNRVVMNNPHDANLEDILLHLWFFKAGTDRPNAYDDQYESAGLVDAADGPRYQKWCLDWYGW